MQRHIPQRDATLAEPPRLVDTPTPVRTSLCYVAAERRRQNTSVWTAALRVRSLRCEEAWATSSTHCLLRSFGRKLHLHAAVIVKGVTSRLWEEVAVSRLKLTALSGARPPFCPIFRVPSKSPFSRILEGFICRHKAVGGSKGYLHFECGVVP